MITKTKEKKTLLIVFVDIFFSFFLNVFKMPFFYRLLDIVALELVL